MTNPDLNADASVVDYGGPTPPTYAHARYAARETPGIIWSDPRDGREASRIEYSEGEIIAASDQEIIAAGDERDCIDGRQ